MFNLLAKRTIKQSNLARVVFTPRTNRFYSSFELGKEEDEEEIIEEPNLAPETYPRLPKEKAHTPRKIVEELDRFIVGQKEAKKAVAIALRNRWRRHQLDPAIREEVFPKNILMVGPTGVGKTEIARRLAKLAQAPFIKVESTQFTEVGFHGRDVDTIIHDLVRESMEITKKNLKKSVYEVAKKAAAERILDALIGPARSSTRDQFREQLLSGALDEQIVTVKVRTVQSEPPGYGGKRAPDRQIRQFLSSLMSAQQPYQSIRDTVKNNFRRLIDDECEKRIPRETLTREALRAAEEDGIVFLDEIDKIARPSGSYYSSADASAEGVQRDLLPLLEGTTVMTDYGPVKTDNILFIACGAFHSVKPSDLMAELQGRLPVRVELKGLTEEDLLRILKEPENNLIKQNIELLKTENINLVFTDEAIKEIARSAAEVNRSIENIGARRLYTILEKILEDVSFEAPDMEPGTEVTITEEKVKEVIKEFFTQKGDYKKFLL